MGLVNQLIEIISAPSILGLKPTGVEQLAQSLLDRGLKDMLHSTLPVHTVPTHNQYYNTKRDAETKCLNTEQIVAFSKKLIEAVSKSIDKNYFPIVLGGDCSILTGILPVLKARGNYGLVFLDAHADFYAPEQSLTGEVADMDLAIVTGRGHLALTNINGLKPYVEDRHVIHIGQRDWEETKKYGSEDIRNTGIRCFSFKEIEEQGIQQIIVDAVAQLKKGDTEGYWLHFDTDVLSDDINPAVDYRLPGGMSYLQVEHLIRNLLDTGRICGLSITIFNPRLDRNGTIAEQIVQCLGRVFAG